MRVRNRQVNSAIFATLLVVGVAVVSAAFAGDVRDFRGQQPSSTELIEALALPTSERTASGLSSSPEKAFKQKYRGIQVVASPKEIVKGRKGVSLSIQFEFNSAELTSDSKRILDSVGVALTSPELIDDRFVAIGHTDSIGSDAYNMALSERRASAVQDYLVSRFGLNPSRVYPHGAGETTPIDPAHSEAPENRRVEIYNFGR